MAFGWLKKGLSSAGKFVTGNVGGAIGGLLSPTVKTPGATGLETQLGNQIAGNLKNPVNMNYASSLTPTKFDYANGPAFKFNFADPKKINSMYDKKYQGERADILSQSNDALTQANQSIGTRDAGARALAATSIGRGTGQALASSKNNLDIGALSDIIQQQQAQQQAQAGENLNRSTLLGSQQRDTAGNKLSTAQLLGDQQKSQQEQQEALMDLYQKLYGSRLGAGKSSPSLIQQGTEVIDSVTGGKGMKF